MVLNRIDFAPLWWWFKLSSLFCLLCDQEYFRSVIHQREVGFQKHQAESLDRNQPVDVSIGADADQPPSQSTTPSVPLLCMVLDASGISGMDASGMNTLRAIIEDQQKRDPPVELILSGQKGPLRQSLRKSGECNPSVFRQPGTRFAVEWHFSEFRMCWCNMYM